VGTVNFRTNEETVIKIDEENYQIWSDAVNASACQNRTAYNGGSSAPFLSDCRGNASHAGVSMFSWCAVVRFQDELCPGDWRIPSLQDFLKLNIVLGGSGDPGNITNATVAPRYLSIWNGVYRGYYLAAGGALQSTANAIYWASESVDATTARWLSINVNSYNHVAQSKGFGLQLRCVRDSVEIAPPDFEFSIGEEDESGEGFLLKACANSETILEITGSDSFDGIQWDREMQGGGYENICIDNNCEGNTATIMVGAEGTFVNYWVTVRKGELWSERKLITVYSVAQPTAIAYYFEGYPLFACLEKPLEVQIAEVTNNYNGSIDWEEFSGVGGSHFSGANGNVHLYYNAFGVYSQGIRNIILKLVNGHCTSDDVVIPVSFEQGTHRTCED
jgi:uncharacterized protein (TIGR02145 family)